MVKNSFRKPIAKKMAEARPSLFEQIKSLEALRAPNNRRAINRRIKSKIAQYYSAYMLSVLQSSELELDEFTAFKPSEYQAWRRDYMEIWGDSLIEGSLRERFKSQWHSTMAVLALQDPDPLSAEYLSAYLETISEEELGVLPTPILRAVQLHFSYNQQPNSKIEAILDGCDTEKKAKYQDIASAIRALPANDISADKIYETIETMRPEVELSEHPLLHRMREQAWVELLSLPRAPAAFKNYQADKLTLLYHRLEADVPLKNARKYWLDLELPEKIEVMEQVAEHFFEVFGIDPVPIKTFDISRNAYQARLREKGIRKPLYARAMAESGEKVDQDLYPGIPDNTRLVAFNMHADIVPHGRPYLNFESTLIHELIHIYQYHLKDRFDALEADIPDQKIEDTGTYQMGKRLSDSFNHLAKNEKYKYEYPIYRSSLIERHTYYCEKAWKTARRQRDPSYLNQPIKWGNLTSYPSGMPYPGIDLRI